METCQVTVNIQGKTMIAATFTDFKAEGTNLAFIDIDTGCIRFGIGFNIMLLE
jgi:hypothetical protein